METTHHMLLTKRWLEVWDASDDTIARTVLWAAMPDLIQDVIGYEHRGTTHFEISETRGGQIHMMDRSRFIEVLDDEVPWPWSEHDLDECAKAGLFLHLAQDAAYDEWLGRYVKQEGSLDPDAGTEDRGIPKEGAFSYFRADTEDPICAEDIAFLKRWSWGVGLRHELDLLGYKGKVSPASLPKPLADIIAVAKKQPIWDDAFEETLSLFWDKSISQEEPPASMADITDAMRDDLVNSAYLGWVRFL